MVKIVDINPLSKPQVFRCHFVKSIFTKMILVNVENNEKKNLVKYSWSWSIRKNLGIEDLMSALNIVGETKAARLRWFGHMQRMGQNAKRAYLR